MRQQATEESLRQLATLQQATETSLRSLADIVRGLADKVGTYDGGGSRTGTARGGTRTSRALSAGTALEVPLRALD